MDSLVSTNEKLWTETDIRLMMVLSERPASIRSLALQLQISRAVVKHHCSKLIESGWIKEVGVEKVGCVLEAIYSLARSHTELKLELSQNDAAMGHLLLSNLKTGLMAFIDSGSENGAYISYTAFRIKPDQASELAQRLKELALEFHTYDDENAIDWHDLFIAFYPRASGDSAEN